MADDTEIGWTDATWNPIVGCSRVSEGCRNCYAERFVHRFAGPGQRWDGLTKSTPSGPRWAGEARLVPGRLDQPLRWKRPRKIFVNSMSDLFHESLTNEQIAAVFGAMLMAPQHTFQVLTKRPARMREWFAWIDRHHDISDRQVRRCVLAFDSLLAGFRGHVSYPVWPLPNVWLGVSVENQAAANERIPLLLQTPAAVRFLSCEPLLGAVDVSRYLKPTLHTNGGEQLQHPQDSARIPSEGGAWSWGVDWVIAGGESGPGARPMQTAWARSLRDQCAESGVPFFFKQWGDWQDVDSKEAFEAMAYRYESPNERWVNLAGGHGYHGESVRLMRKVGKRAAGKLLDGREHQAFPVQP